MLHPVAVRSLSKAIFVGFAEFVAALGCGRVPLDVGDGGSKADRTGDNPPVCVAPPCVPPPPPPCDGLDETTCKMRSDCQASYICCGPGQFVACGDSGVAVACLPTTCPLPCEGRDETACMNSTGECSPRYCPNCDGGQAYEGCS